MSLSAVQSSFFQSVLPTPDTLKKTAKVFGAVAAVAAAVTAVALLAIYVPPVAFAIAPVANLAAAGLAKVGISVTAGKLASIAGAVAASIATAALGLNYAGSRQKPAEDKSEIEPKAEAPDVVLAQSEPQQVTPDDSFAE